MTRVFNKLVVILISIMTTIRVVFYRECQSRIIRINLTGGLGNQLFQFSAAVNLALKYDFKLTVQAPKVERLYSLHYFGIDVNEVYKVSLSGSSLNFATVKKCLFCKYFEVKESQIEDVNLYSLSHVQLSGYFQNMSFIESNLDSLCNFFKEGLEAQSSFLELGAQNIIQVRLGDLVTNPTYNKVHGVVDQKYLMEAVKRFNLNFRDFSIISDDDQHFKALMPLISSSGAELLLEGSEIRDFLLMYRSQRLIISNSTFGWWAGYLGNPKVVAPINWYTDPQKQEKDAPLIRVKDWIYI